MRTSSSALGRVAGAVLSIALLAGCGTDLSRQEIVAAQQGDATSTEVGGAAVPTADLTKDATTGAATSGLPPVGDTTAGAATPAASGAGVTGSSGSQKPGAVTTDNSAGQPGKTGGGTAVAAGPATGTPILLGNVGNYSGPLSIGTVSVPKALQVWSQWVNARGGINGHVVKVISGDDGGDPSRSLSVVKNLVENQKVVAFISNMTILTLSASLQYLEGKRIPTIGGDTTNVLWNQSPMLFPQSTSINELIKAVPRTAVADGAKKFGLLYCIEAEVCRNVNKVLWDDNGATGVGAEKTFNAQVSITQPDFTSECLQMQSRGVQAVFAATDGATAIRIAQSCARQGFKPRYYIASLVVIEGQAKVKELDGTRAPVGNFPWMASVGAAGEYAQAMSKYAPGLINSQGTSAAWVSGKVLEKAAAKIAAGAQPTSDAILRGLWTVKNDTFGGLAPPLTFLENKPAPEARCYFYVELAGGQWASKSGMKQTCP